MSFSQYSDYTVRMISELPSCPDQIILQEMQRAAYDVFRFSEGWREKLITDIVNAEDTYTVSYSGDASVFRIYQVKMKAQSSDSFDNLIPVDTYKYEYVEDDHIRFFADYIPTIDLTDGMQIEVAVVPNLTALGIPTWLMNRYAACLMAKCKFNLMMQPNKPWSNVQLAQYWYTIYQKEQRDLVRDKYAGRLNNNIMAIQREWI